MSAGTRVERQRAEHRAREQARGIVQRLREISIRMVRQGQDPVPLLAELERRLREEQRKL